MKKNDFDLNRIAYIDLSRLVYNSKENGAVKMYLKPKNENLKYASNKYMEEISLNIKTIYRYQADRMF